MTRTRQNNIKQYKTQHKESKKVFFKEVEMKIDEEQ